jgi:hypothetical protein
MMNQRDVRPLVAEFKRNKLVLGLLLADFSEDDLRRRVMDANPALWILGHLAMIRLSLGRRIGLQTETQEWEAAFGRGSDGQALPPGITKKALLEVIDSGHEELLTTIAGLSQEQLQADSGRQYPDGGNDVFGMISFLAWHEAYHLGQVGFIRSCLGKPGLA